ncbi:MAG: RNA polymerase sigma factor [Thermoleophilia bacterium]
MSTSSPRDPAEFRELYDRLSAEVFRYHLRRCGDADLAEDLTAETFARVWLGRAKAPVAADGNPAPWVFGIARNVLRECVRRRGVELRACRRLGLRDRLDGGPAHAVPDEGWMDGADALLDRLPADQRTAVRMHVIDGFAHEEVAQRLDINPATARARVSRGLRALRRHLTSEGSLS